MLAQSTQDNRAAIFPRDARQFCYMHNRMCFTNPGFVINELQAGRAGRRCAVEAQQPLDSVTGGTPTYLAPWWTRGRWWDGDGGEEENAVGRPLLFSFDSPPCVDFSPRGKMEGAGGATQDEHHAWAAERTEQAEAGDIDITFMENVKCYPMSEYMETTFGRTHYVRHILTDPQMGGFPVRRPRRMAAAINKATLIWVGPDQDEMNKVYDKVFGRTTILDGDVFFVAKPAEIHDTILAMAKARKKTLPVNWRKVPFTNLLPLLLPAGAMGRLGEYERARGTAGGAYIVDLDNHEVDYGAGGPKACTSFPCLLTHHSVYSFAKERLATPGECFSSMGVDVYPELIGMRDASPLWCELRKLSHRNCEILAGNSLHIPSALAWMLYIWANCVRRSDHERLSPAVGPPNIADAEAMDVQEDMFEDHRR